MSGRRAIGVVLAVVGIVLVVAACLSNTPDGNEGQVRTTPQTVSLSPAAPAQPSPSRITISASTSMSLPATTSSAPSSVVSPPPTEPSPASSQAPTTEQAAPVVATIAPAPPTRLQIPAIGMDIQGLGEVASVRDGESWSITPPEETLEDLQNAYWWNEHQAPGNPAEGTVFFYMHSCKKVSCAGDNLSQLAVGDPVQVTTLNGVLTYQVTDKKSYSKEGDDKTGNSEEVYNYDQPGVLRIITCGYTGDISDINWVITTQLV